MPFHQAVRVELVNGGEATVPWLYFQIDYTLGPVDETAGERRNRNWRIW